MPEADWWQHFHFLRPWTVLLLLPALAIALSLRRRDVDRDMFRGIIAPHLLQHLRLPRSYRRWLTPRTLSYPVLLLLLLIVMGPSWRQQPSPLAQDSTALVILLDVSSSMEQRDIQPSRLQRAKQKISDLLALRPDKKAAVIAYAGSAHTVISLTADRDILRQYLAAIKPSIMPRAGKFAEYALPEIDAVLQQARSRASVVLLTDGVGSATTAAFRDYFAQQPYQLLILAVGKEQVVEGDVPLQRDALQELAGAAGGSLVDLTTDDSDVRKLNRRIDSHYVVIEDAGLPWLDSGYGLVFPALALFLLWFRKGWTLSWMWLLLPLLALPPSAPVVAGMESSRPGFSQTTPAAELPGPESANGAASAPAPASPLAHAWQWFTKLWLTADQQGRILLQRGDYLAAASHFRDPLWQGIAAYYAQDFMLAAEYFSRSDSDLALFNEATARAQARDYLRAVNRYDQLLARNHNYPGAAHNRTLVQELIDEINRLSASQQPEAGDSGDDRSLEDDDPRAAEGADEIVWKEAKVKQLSAEQILQDPATAAMWLRGVQRDPSNFLATKFNMQLQQRGAAPEPSP